jgi:DNA-binding IclR family transcriptional regulator
MLRSVGSALELVRQLGGSESGIGVTEAARALGVAPSTAHRLLTTLVGAGFAIREPGGRRYRRGPALLRLGSSQRVLPDLLVRDAARAVLERVSRETGETAHLSVLDGLDVIGIDHVVSDLPVVYRHPIGSRVPAHATAVGHALLAYSPEAAEALIAEGLTQITDATLPHGDALRRALDAVRRRGYAINDRGWHTETAGVAAPILWPASGGAVAALGISGPANRLPHGDGLGRLGRFARTAAAEVATRLPPPVSHPRGT